MERKGIVHSFFLRISLNSLLSGWSRCAPDKTGSEDFYGFVPTPGYLANNWNCSLVDVPCHMFPGRCVCIDVGYDSARVDTGSTVLWGTCLSSLRRGHANLLCIIPVLEYVLPKRALHKCILSA